MNTGSDAEVMAGSVADPRTFATVYDRHAGVLFRFLVRRVGRETADELLGDTFRIAFEKRATYDVQRANARPWLYGIATNLVARHRRAEGRRLRAMGGLAADRPAAAVDDRVVEAVDASRRWDHVLDGVAALPDGERDALLLFAWEDLSYDEIATALAIPVGTVRSRINRARGRLRELDSAGDEEQLKTAAPDRLRIAEPNDPWVLAEEKDRLMSTIEHTPAEPTAAWKPPAIYPRLGYHDERAAIDFLTRAFGFTERVEARVEHGDHVLAWLDHGDGVVMVGHVQHDVHGIHSPAETGAATCMLNVTVDDVDAHMERAVREGARLTMELGDAFFGERRYEAEDPEGNRWHFGEPLANVRRRTGG